MTFRAGRLAMLASVALLAGPLGAAPARAADSLSVRFEVGSTSDVSNEQFYESAIDDTTFLGRRLHGSPQTRVAAVMFAEVSGASSDGRWRGQLAPSVSIGDKTTRISATGLLEGRPGDRTRFSLEPRVEFQRDESFGLHRRQWRSSLAGRARRLSLDGSGAARLTAASEVVRAAAGSDPFVLSGTSSRASLGYERTPLVGLGWNLEYGAVGRVFRDSTARDHVEHHVEIGAREDFMSGHTVALEAGADRRLALRAVPGSRDRFVQGYAQADASIELAAAWSLRPTARAEGTSYDEPDSLLDFDYQQYGAGLAIRRELGADWRVTAGLRAEWLRTAWCPGEEFDELALAVELEWLAVSGWWNLTPVAGRRSYHLPSPALPLARSLAGAPHSNFDFAEVTGYVDHRLPAAVVVHMLGTVRLERHTNRDDDARSFYFSLDVRRLF